MKLFQIVVNFCILFELCSTEPTYPFKVDMKLDDYNGVRVNWRTDIEKERVFFALECSLEAQTQWMAFGFSEHGEYEKSTLCIWDGIGLTDSFVDDHGAIRTDQRGNCRFENVDYYPDGRLTLYFWRQFDTCDGQYLIEDGTTQLAFLAGKTTRRNVFGDNVLKMIQPTRLIERVATPSISQLETTQILDITSKNVSIPAKETTYWCTVWKLPAFHQKRHIIKYEANIQKANAEFVHHMEVFHCEKPPDFAGRLRFPMYQGECHSPDMPSLVKACKRVTAAWAMGAQPVVYPEETGIPIGGSGYFPFLMLEVHYNNPQKKAGSIDSSGIRFYYTSEVRKYDAGILEVGLEYTDRMAIPPGQSMFSLSGYCTAECTDALLPKDGITIFASQLHAHLTGRRLMTTLVREGVEIAVVNGDPHYSPDWQEIRPVKTVQVLPGDTLITRCDYDTSKRNNVTLTRLHRLLKSQWSEILSGQIVQASVLYLPEFLIFLLKNIDCGCVFTPIIANQSTRNGMAFFRNATTIHTDALLLQGGFAITDEMCVNYIHYYPKSNLEVCKSAVDNKTLQTYFAILREEQNQPTRESFAVAENYKALRWNDKMTHDLARFYEWAPVFSECRQNDGTLLQLGPIKPIPVIFPLEKQQKRCGD